MRHILCILAIAGVSTTARAQTPASAPEPLPDAQQITAAVLALPAEYRATATVLGYRAGTPRLAKLRQGSGPFNCLAPDPAAQRFHVACYHESLEPFMARGRALRAAGVTGEKVDSTRFREVKAGKLKMPKQPAALYSLSGESKVFDAAAGTATGARPLQVIYIPNATAASTGLSAKPAEGTPWIMFPGTPKAHIMFVPRM